MLSLAKYNDELGPIFVSAPVSQVSYNAQKRWDLMHWLKHYSEAAEAIGLARTHLVKQYLCFVMMTQDCVENVY